MSFIRSYVVPEGFPHSVTPSYVPYMSWRALKVYFHYSILGFHDQPDFEYVTYSTFFPFQHFFGGAMGVFTTRTLLNSVGVSQSKAVPGAVAINWILKASVFLEKLAKIFFFAFLVYATFIQIMYENNQACWKFLRQRTHRLYLN
jgi:hypothetical protein